MIPTVVFFPLSHNYLPYKREYCKTKVQPKPTLQAAIQRPHALFTNTFLLVHTDITVVLKKEVENFELQKVLNYN